MPWPEGYRALSPAEFERLVMLVRKEQVGQDPPPLWAPRKYAENMRARIPSVAWKWLRDECLLDEQQEVADAVA